MVGAQSRREQENRWEPDHGSCPITAKGYTFFPVGTLISLKMCILERSLQMQLQCRQMEDPRLEVGKPVERLL